MKPGYSILSQKPKEHGCNVNRHPSPPRRKKTSSLELSLI